MKTQLTKNDPPGSYQCIWSAYGIPVVRRWDGKFLLHTDGSQADEGSYHNYERIYTQGEHRKLADECSEIIEEYKTLLNETRSYLATANALIGEAALGAELVNEELASLRAENERMRQQLRELGK